MENLISIGKILNFHGIKGEVKTGYTKGREHQLASVRKMYVKLSDNQYKELNVQNIRFHKSHALIKFAEINSINDVEKIKTYNLYISKDYMKSFLQDDEYLISDLNGLQAYDTNDKLLGIICAVGENPAASILTIKDKNDKLHMVPFVKDLVPVVDIENKKIIINNIEGLVD